MPVGHDNLTAAEVARLIEVSVHTLSYWRQSNQGPQPLKAGKRTLYRRADVEHWLADIDGRTQPAQSPSSNWYQRAIEAAEQIDPRHTAPWKLASTYALLAIAESVIGKRPTRAPERAPSPPASELSDTGLLTIDEVAAMTRISRGTLRYWRHTGTAGPPSFKLGRRVLYRRSDVEAWLRSART